MEEGNRLILWGWYHSIIVQNYFIPDIEKNCIQYGVKYPMAYEIFQHNKCAMNSLYFEHSPAESEIPMGQEYQKIALMKNYKILTDSIQTCHSKVICFFTVPRIQPSESAWIGYHGPCLIQFEQGIPQMIFDELLEIAEFPINLTKIQICLF